jgi:hypothetical protein
LAHAATKKDMPACALEQRNIHELLEDVRFGDPPLKGNGPQARLRLTRDTTLHAWVARHVCSV